MPCFDPRDVIFITNKWDSIPKEESDSEEEGGEASQEGGGDHSEGSNKGSDMEDD